MSEQLETERRLLAEADYLFDPDAWETTHDDLNGLAEESDLYCAYDGRVTTVCRLKKLPSIYVVNLPVAWEDGEPTDWEVKVFETAEAAADAFKVAADAGRAALAETR